MRRGNGTFFSLVIGRGWYGTNVPHVRAFSALNSLDLRYVGRLRINVKIISMRFILQKRIVSIVGGSLELYNAEVDTLSMNMPVGAR